MILIEYSDCVIISSPRDARMAARVTRPAADTLTRLHIKHSNLDPLTNGPLIILIKNPGPLLKLCTRTPPF